MDVPALQLPAELARRFEEQDAEQRARIEGYLRTAPRPCVYFHGERVGEKPLQRSGVGKLVGLRPAEPQLAPLASKLGGITYAEPSLAPAKSDCFVGQINFAELTARPELTLPELPSRGILAIDANRQDDAAPLRVRWYPDPSPDRAHPVQIESLGRYEAALKFEAGWSLPGGPAWEEPLPDDVDGELVQAWQDWNPEGYLEDENRDWHRLLGHPAAGLYHNYGFVPPSGGSEEIRDYEMLARFTFDNAAGFSWGSNIVYLIIGRDDLAAGRLDRAVSTVANY